MLQQNQNISNVSNDRFQSEKQLVECLGRLADAVEHRLGCDSNTAQLPAVLSLGSVLSAEKITDWTGVRIFETWGPDSADCAWLHMPGDTQLSCLSSGARCLLQPIHVYCKHMRRVIISGRSHVRDCVVNPAGQGRCSCIEPQRPSCHLSQPACKSAAPLLCFSRIHLSEIQTETSLDPLGFRQVSTCQGHSRLHGTQVAAQQHAHKLSCAAQQVLQQHTSFSCLLRSQVTSMRKA